MSTGAAEAPTAVPHRSIITVCVMVATLIQISILLAMRKKVDTMLWVTFGLIAILGGATVWFHDPTFIKWKPSALYWAMGLVLWLSQALFKKNLLQALIGTQLDLPDPVWRRLNIAWAIFFILMGFANIYVAYAYSISTWATFKVFGLTGIMLVFMVAQGFYISRHLKDDSPPPPDKLPAPPAGAGQEST